MLFKIKLPVFWLRKWNSKCQAMRQGPMSEQASSGTFSGLGSGLPWIKMHSVCICATDLSIMWWNEVNFVELADLLSLAGSGFSDRRQASVWPMGGTEVSQFSGVESKYEAFLREWGGKGKGCHSDFSFFKHILLIMLLQFSWFFSPSHAPSTLHTLPCPPAPPPLNSCPWAVHISSLASLFPILCLTSPYFMPASCAA